MKQKLSLILVIMLVVVTIGCVLPSAAFAATDDVDVSKYTDVWDDLNQDSTFAKTQASKLLPESYYGLNLFQIAESSDGELFVYVAWRSAFTPQVTCINMS